MLIFGHRFIASPRFYHIDGIDTIAHTPGGSLLYLPFAEENLDIISHMTQNGLEFALEAASLREVVYAENLGAKFIIIDNELASEAQKCAENYLFDAKILCRIDDEDKIEVMAEAGIDGVLFTEAIIKVTG